MNKHPGTHGLTPTLVYFNIVPAHMIRTKSPKKHVHSHLWTLKTLSPYLHQLRVLVLKRASTVQTIESHFYVYK